MNKHDFPQIHFYDQDFVDIYNKTWSWVSSFWIDPATGEQANDGLFIYPENGKITSLSTAPTANVWSVGAI